MENSDWAVLFKRFDQSKLKFNENKHLFTKVAWDLYQLNSSPIEALWILDADESGQQYLVATYDEQAKPLETTGHWKALSNKEASATTLYYKDIPVCKFASADFGVGAEDIVLFERVLAEKANTNQDFARKVLAAQPKEKQSIILQQYPELI